MWSVILSLSISVYGAHAMSCYDKYTSRYYETGGQFMREKPMRNSNLTGTYDCTCHSGGLVYCTAVDIPCYDSYSRNYVPKEERFQTNLLGKKVNCLCKGGRGRFEDCHAGCLDVQTGQNVLIGQPYAVKCFGRNFQCLCGESGRPVRGTCRRQLIPVDACLFARTNCDPQALCTPQGSSYTCQCKAGYTGDGSSCTDINECLELNECNENAHCTNTAGSYTCACHEGYTGDGFRCEKEIVDHCSQNVFFCDISARCIPSDTSFSCVCNLGYTGDGFTCKDRDECTDGSHGCHYNADCNNAVGSYECSCKFGYHGDGYRCSKMCRDESTKRFVQRHDIFTKIKNGREVRCTCAEDGGHVEGSCIGEPPEIQIGSTCLDDRTGKRVDSGEYFTKRSGNGETRCRCREGKAEPGSCRQGQALVQQIHPTSVAPAIRCLDRRKRIYYEEGETYTRTRNGITYRCTCTRRRNSAISECKRERSKTGSN